MNSILVNVNNHVGTISFNNEKSLNSFNNNMLSEIYDALDQFNEDLDVRVIMIRGTDKFFSAGDNLKGMSTDENPDQKNIFDKYYEGYPRVINKMRNLNKPVISFVEKFAYGAAFEIVLASDFSYATNDTKFGLPFVKRGIASGTSLLLDYIDYKRATDILFTGRDVTVQEASDYGFISEYGTKEEMSSAIDVLTEVLIQLPTETIGLIKRSLNDNLSKPLDARFRNQCLYTSLSATTLDFKEGHQSFIEKREPIFNRGDSNEH